jgi:hypothetical protein
MASLSITSSVGHSPLLRSLALVLPPKLLQRRTLDQLSRLLSLIHQTWPKPPSDDAPLPRGFLRPLSTLPRERESCGSGSPHLLPFHHPSCTVVLETCSKILMCQVSGSTAVARSIRPDSLSLPERNSKVAYSRHR